MRAGRLAASLALVTLTLACGDIVAQAGPGLVVELQIEMEYEDLEFGLEGYAASYIHTATLTLTGSNLDGEIRQTRWEGFEVCYEPTRRIEWDSDIDFEDLAFTAPEMRALARGNQVWLLYAPAREFGVEDPGGDTCHTMSAMTDREMVMKHFFEADLGDLATPQGDFPVYFYDEEEAFGGIVLAAWPLTELQSGGARQIDIDYSGADSMQKIALRAKGTVTPR